MFSRDYFSSVDDDVESIGSGALDEDFTNAVLGDPRKEEDIASMVSKLSEADDENEDCSGIADYRTKVQRQNGQAYEDDDSSDDD
jgi:hypothetical protein